MKDKLYTILFAAVFGTLCGALLTWVDSVTRSKLDSARIRSVLAVLEIPVAKGATDEDLSYLFKREVEAVEKEGLRYFRHVEDGRLQAAAVHFEGFGMWGEIKGYLALEADMRTIRSVSFYELKETAGKGARIAEPEFRDQFKGKRIMDAAGVPGIRIKKGKGHTEQNAVDAITGATVTCGKVEAILNDAIKRFVKEVADGQ